MAQTLTKQEKQWNRQLTQQLDRYSTLRDWSQLAAWLSRLKSHLNDRKGPISDKVALLKRLATSLNASLPVALHESTLQTYELLFSQALITGQELSTVCIGLFSFFTQANVKNKMRLVQIFTKHLMPYGKDLQILATGLAITILPSLNEMHEALVKQVTNFLDNLARPQLIGSQTLSEAIWIAILRSPGCRVAGLKFLSTKLGRGSQEQQQHDEQDTFWNEATAISKITQDNKKQKLNQDQAISAAKSRDLLKEYCPYIETLVINALTICIQDANVLAIKAGLDFLYKYLPLRSEAISDEAKLKLTRSVIWLLGKRDTSVTRKINLWFFGKPDDENRYEVNQKHLSFVTQALILYLNGQKSLQPLKITINLLTEHDELPSIILLELVPHLLKFCQRQEASTETAKEVVKQMHRFIERIRPHLHLFSLALSQSLMKSISRKKYQQAQQSLNLTIYFISKILKQEQVKDALKYILKMLLKGSILTQWENRSFMRLSFKQTLQLFEKYKDILKEITLDEQIKQLLMDHNKLFGDLLKLAAVKQNQEPFEQEIYLMNKMMVKIEDIFEVYCQQWMPNIVKNIALNNPQHFLAPIEIIGEAMEKEGILKKQILLIAEDVSKYNCLKICLSKLWGILSLGHLQVRVIPLLLRLVKHFPGFFQKLLEGEFQTSGQLAIIKFRLFWEVSPKYPLIMGFQQVQQVCKFGLFKMLQFLDSQNPLVKYHSHLWIRQTYPAFHRVLNPILQIMLKPKNCWYRTPQGQFIYAVAPQIKKVLQMLRFLRSFVRLVPQKFNKFAFKPLTAKILPYYYIFRGEDPSQQSLEIPYITPILQLVVRFTETKFVGGDNKGIDLAACELLQTIIKVISTPELSNYLLTKHFKDLLRSLHFSTVNQEHLLQIQLINLLKYLFGESQVKRLADQRILKQAIGQANLVETILQGVGCAFPYIKQRFVEFLNDCIPLLIEHHSGCAEAVSRVLNTYTNKIAYVNSKKVEASSLKDLQISQKNAEILILFSGIKELLSLFLNLHLRPFEKQKNHNDTDLGLFSFYSWKSYISLKIERKPEIRVKKMQEQICKQIINQLPSLIAIMTACWTISQLKPIYGISKEGFKVFNYEQFLEYNKALAIAQNRLETEESVENFIVCLLRVLLNTYSGQTMRAIVNCWSTATKDIDTRIKLLQLLTFSGLPIEHFYSMLGQSINVEKIGRKRKGASMEFQRNNQQDVLQLCQAFSHYNFQNPSFFQPHNLTSIWLSFCKFLRFFETTKNTLTLYNILELIDLFLNKNNPKQIMRDEKIKKQFGPLINAHNDLILLITAKIKIEIPTGNVRLSSLFPLPSSVHQLRTAALKEQNQMGPAYLVWDQCSPAKSSEYVKLMGLAVGRRISYNIIANLQNQSEINLVRRVRELISSILPLIHDKTLDSLIVEGASEFVLCLLEQQRQLYVKEVKSQILQIFNKQDFFICTSRTLQSWARIIDLLIDNCKDHDIFQQYLEKVSLTTTLFTARDTETKKKIKSFERICFILYAGKKDKYTDKAQLLIDKIIEVIKQTESPQPVLILIFFCIRILILRLSQQKLTKLLSTLWQMIIFLLSNIFGEPAHKDRLNLHWAALKLVEMISLMQISQFHPHQWIFFYDFVGVKFTTHFDIGRQIKLGINPKIHKFLPGDILLLKQETVNVQQKRHLLIKQDKIDDIELLKTKALLLSSYLVASNGCRMRFDMKEVEELIDNDFLSLDSFIYQVK